MPSSLLEAYETLTLEAQQEVEHLIYFLLSQQKKKKSQDNGNSSIIDSFLGKCSSWNKEDALTYQNNLRKEERV